MIIIIRKEWNEDGGNVHEMVVMDYATIDVELLKITGESTGMTFEGLSTKKSLVSFLFGDGTDSISKQLLQILDIFGLLQEKVLPL